jgi:hypothetical protein
MNARIIDHDEAVKGLMAERYLLGELNATERDSYEEHLFCCDACFQQVKAGTELIGELRHIGPERLQPSLVPGFISQIMPSLRQSVTIAACTLLICVSVVSVYQQRTISGLSRPQVTPSFFLSDGAKAGGVKKLILPPNTRFNLSIQLLQRGDFSAYQGQLLDQSGHQKSTFPISMEQTLDTIHLLLDSNSLKTGTYFIVVNGFTPEGQKTEITRYTFEFQSKD